ncbi:MAG: hypothetical protein U9Q66_02300 [Patescibacteria group bacterium]|nr:hypothetical protein [Patescibacteria group bacterium]
MTNRNILKFGRKLDAGYCTVKNEHNKQLKESALEEKIKQLGFNPSLPSNFKESQPKGVLAILKKLPALHFLILFFFF